MEEAGGTAGKALYASGEAVIDIDGDESSSATNEEVLQEEEEDLGDEDEEDDGDEEEYEEEVEKGVKTGKRKAKASGGRKSAIIFSFFKQTSEERDAISKRLDYKCQYCQTEFLSAQAKTLEKHALRHCKKWPAAIRATVSGDITAAKKARQSAAAVKAAKKVESAAASSRTELIAAAKASRIGGGGASSSGIGSSGGKMVQGCLDAHFPKAASTKPFTAEEKECANSLLLIWLLSSGVAFNAVDSVFFLVWVLYISNNRYIPASESIFGLVANAIVPAD
jgi:hypothetical protein